VDRKYPELADAFYKEVDHMLARIEHPASIPEWAEEAMDYVDVVGGFLGEHGAISKYDWERLSGEIHEIASKRFGKGWYVKSLKSRAAAASRTAKMLR